MQDPVRSLPPSFESSVIMHCVNILSCPLCFWLLHNPAKGRVRIPSVLVCVDQDRGRSSSSSRATVSSLAVVNLYFVFKLPTRKVRANGEENYWLFLYTISHLWAGPFPVELSQEILQSVLAKVSQYNSDLLLYMFIRKSIRSCIV